MPTHGGGPFRLSSDASLLNAMPRHLRKKLRTTKDSVKLAQIVAGARARWPNTGRNGVKRKRTQADASDGVKLPHATKHVVTNEEQGMTKGDKIGTAVLLNA